MTSSAVNLRGKDADLRSCSLYLQHNLLGGTHSTHTVASLSLSHLKCFMR